MAVVMVALDGGFFDGPVHALDLAVIRYVIRGAFPVRLCFSKNSVMVSPSGMRGAGARRCGQAVDKHWAESPSSLHGRPLRLSRMRCERGSVDVVLPASSRFY